MVKEGQLKVLGELVEAAMAENFMGNGGAQISITKMIRIVVNDKLIGIRTRQGCGPVFGKTACLRNNLDFKIRDVPGNSP